MSLFHFLFISEMLFINLYVSYMCSKKKKSPLVTWAVLIIFTVILFALLRPITNNIPNYGNGNGLLVLVGFLYIFPLKYLYDQPVKYTLAIMFSSWIYTMFAFLLSFRVGYFLPSAQLNFSVLLIQTIFYVVTLPYFMRFIRQKFIYILQNVEKQALNLLLLLSFLWFIFIVLLNYVFIEGSTPSLEFIVISILAVNAMLFYKLFYSLVTVNKKVKNLSEKAKRDPLTKLKNREALYEDALQRIRKNKPFKVIFMDLDRFKDINDRFGHGVGDDYLVEFVSAVKKIFNMDSAFYRMSGDEFVIIYEGKNIDSFCHQLESLEFKNRSFDIPFYSLSLGYASFPSDGDNLSDLLYLADLNMYQKKKEKHRSIIPSN